MVKKNKSEESFDISFLLEMAAVAEKASGGGNAAEDDPEVRKLNEGGEPKSKTGDVTLH